MYRLLGKKKEIPLNNEDIPYTSTQADYTHNSRGLNKFINMPYIPPPDIDQERYGKQNYLPEWKNRSLFGNGSTKSYYFPKSLDDRVYRNKAGPVQENKKLINAMAWKTYRDPFYNNMAQKSGQYWQDGPYEQYPDIGKLEAENATQDEIRKAWDKTIRMPESLIALNTQKPRGLYRSYDLTKEQKTGEMIPDNFNIADTARQRNIAVIQTLDYLENSKDRNVQLNEISEQLKRGMKDIKSINPDHRSYDNIKAQPMDKFHQHRSFEQNFRMNIDYRYKDQMSSANYRDLQEEAKEVKSYSTIPTRGMEETMRMQKIRTMTNPINLSKPSKERAVDNTAKPRNAGAYFLRGAEFGRLVDFNAMDPLNKPDFGIDRTVSSENDIKNYRSNLGISYNNRFNRDNIFI